MSKINDGGPAFPKAGLDPWGKAQTVNNGMTLRDYFAAKAMQAIIIGNNADECALGIGAAKDAYAVAGAMIEAREIKP